MDDGYLALLARGDTRGLVAALGAGWLSFGMVGLAIFLAAVRGSGSYGLAGIAVAAFALGSGLLAPLRGRILDRRGARPWLPVFAGGYAASLTAFAVLATLRSASWTLVLTAALAGASAPPLVASIRALWTRVVERALLRRAYALTAVVGDVGLVAAPAAGGLLFAVAPWLPLGICALAAVGAAAIVTKLPAASAPDGTKRDASAASFPPALRMILAVEVALGVALGLVEVAIPAAASRWGVTSYSGFLLAAFALGSVAGGIWFGRRSWRAVPEHRYLVAAALLAVALVPPVAASSAAVLAPLLLLAGLGYGPATISLFEALDAFAASRATEALTWVTAAGAAGTAAGSAASGWLSADAGSWAPFATAAAILGVAALSGLAFEISSRGGRARGRRA